MTLLIIRFLSCLVAFVGLPIGHCMAAQTTRLAELSSKRMLNDLQVIVAYTPYLGEDMTIGLVTSYGSAFDPVGKGGLARLVSKMFLKATQDKTAKAIQAEMEYLGVTIDIRSYWDGIRFIMSGKSSRFERSLLLLYQVVGEAVFHEADFNDVKRQIAEEIEAPEDPRQSVLSRFEAVLFKGTSYGRPIKGTKATLQNISIGDVSLFYRRYFLPNAASLIIVGSAPPEVVLQRATRIWGVWVRKEGPPFTFLPPREPASKTVILKDDPNSPAAQFVLGNLWPKREDPDFYGSSLAARILQERLTKALPTSLLTVSAEGRRMLGPFHVQGQAAADQTFGEIQKILDRVDQFKESGVQSEELARVRDAWISEFNQDLASTERLCNLMLDAELYRLGINYSASFPDLVNRHNPDSVQEAAKRWIFPGGVLIYVRGPAARLKTELESLGRVQMAP